MNKLILLAALLALVYADGTITALSLDGTSSGSLVTNNYARFYLDYPENVSQIIVTLTVSSVTSDSCDELYFAVNPIAYPCLSYGAVTPPPNNDGDPCSGYEEITVDSGDTETYYINPGNYYYGLFGDTPIHQSGRLFFQLVRYDSDENCAYTITTATAASECPSPLNSNNGVAVSPFYDDFFQYDSSALRCDVYTNITLQNGVAVYTQLGNLSTSSGELIFKTVIPKNAAYINFTINGTFYYQDSDYENLYVIASPFAVANDTNGDELQCYNYVYPDGESQSSTSGYGTETFTCTNVPAGAMYITVIFDEEEDEPTHFFGTLSSTLIVCPDGTATNSIDDFGNELYDQAYNCSAAYYFNTSSLLNPNIGNISFTNVPEDYVVTGYFDLSQLPGGSGASYTLNFTGCSTSSKDGCEAEMIVSPYMNGRDNSNYYDVDEQYDGFSLSAYDTDSTAYFNLTNQRFYVTYYCYEGPCTSSITLNAAAVVPTTPVTTGLSAFTTGNPSIGAFFGEAQYSDASCTTGLSSIYATADVTNCDDAGGFTTGLGACSATTMQRTFCYSSISSFYTNYPAASLGNALVISGYDGDDCTASELITTEYAIVGVCGPSQGASYILNYCNAAGVATETDYSLANCKGTGTVLNTTSQFDCTPNGCCATEGGYVKYSCINVPGGLTTNVVPSMTTAATSTAKSSTGASTGVRVTTGLTGSVTGTTANSTAKATTTNHVSSSEIIKIGFFALVLGFLLN